LQKSWNEIPHVTQHDEADITEMDAFRKSLKDLYTGEKISVTPLAFIIRAVVQTLKVYPNFNASLDLENEKIIYKKYYHIGIAVDTPHGLMVPKIRDADQKDITTLGKELKRVSKLSSELKIAKREFFGGSMTISSLGSIGGSFFTPIINQPEVAILGVGRAERKQVFMGDKYESRIMLPLSLSYDHRIIDGAEGARFCVHLKESLGKDFAYRLAV
jgi:pyruvate dehydrogenase E2 component (dihydrolipoamide acetyltransferase)